MPKFDKTTIRVGDTILVPLKVTHEYETCCVAAGLNGSSVTSVTIPYTSIHSILHRPLKAGDTVNYSGSPDWEILAIYEDMAWIKDLAKNGTRTSTTSVVRLDCLTRT